MHRDGILHACMALTVGLIYLFMYHDFNITLSLYICPAFPFYCNAMDIFKALLDPDETSLEGPILIVRWRSYCASELMYSSSAHHIPATASTGARAA